MTAHEYIQETHNRTQLTLLKNTGIAIALRPFFAYGNESQKDGGRNIRTAKTDSRPTPAFPQKKDSQLGRANGVLKA
jgi:hypothetical protein